MPTSLFLHIPFLTQSVRKHITKLCTNMFLLLLSHGSPLVYVGQERASNRVNTYTYHVYQRYKGYKMPDNQDINFLVSVMSVLAY